MTDVNSMTSDTKDEPGEVNDENANVSKGDEAIEAPVCTKCDSQPVILPEETPEKPVEDLISFKVIYNKTKYDVQFSASEKVIDLKHCLEKLTSVPVDMQKLLFRGLCPNNETLKSLGISKGAKLMLVGTTPDNVKALQGSSKDLASKSTSSSSAEAAVPESRASQRDLHKRVLEKYGKPEDCSPGIRNANDPLPPVPIAGVYNKAGAKVRLTFKLEIDELWLSTKERTNKIPMSSIRRVVSEPIENNENYHILGIQLGPTEQSLYWVYWVPCQYIRAIKNIIGAPP